MQKIQIVLEIIIVIVTILEQIAKTIQEIIQEIIHVNLGKEINCEDHILHNPGVMLHYLNGYISG